MPPLETHTSPLNSNPFSINHSNMPSSVRAARRNTTLLLLLCLNVWLVSGRRRRKKNSSGSVYSKLHSPDSHCQGPVLSNPGSMLGFHFTWQNLHESTNKSPPQCRDKEVIKNGGEWKSWKSPADERQRERASKSASKISFVFLSAFIGGTVNHSPS